MRPQLIETLRVESDGRMPLLPWHLERLAQSCLALGYRWSVDAVQRAIARAAATLPDGKTWRLRVLVSDDGAIDITSSELPNLANPMRARLADFRLDSHAPLLRHKTTYRPWYDEAQPWLDAHPDYFDLLYLNEREELCEGSRSNVYVLRDGLWYTPPLSSGLLAGVQRAALLDEEQVIERILTLDDLRQAQSLRLSNALRAWFDVLLDPA